jgi:predicted amidohydrolase YtcJ
VRGNEIVYEGPAAVSVSFVDESTEVIDLDSGMCLPGFIDAHDHRSHRQRLAFRPRQVVDATDGPAFDGSVERVS